MENKGEQEERTEENLKIYLRCSHFSREHKDSPDLSLSERSCCRSSLELSENVEKVTLKRHRGEECRQTWRGEGIVQLDGATGGGGKGGAFGGRESSSSESEGDDSSEASGVPRQLHGNCFVNWTNSSLTVSLKLNVNSLHEVVTF